MTSLRTSILATATLLLGTVCTLAQQPDGNGASGSTGHFDTEIMASGLEHPWGLDFLPGGGAIVTERPGRLRLLIDGKLSAPLAGVPKVVARGQGGLLDVVVSPNFATDQLIFFSFSEPGDGGAGTAVARARLVLDRAEPRLEAVEIIFSMGHKTTRGHHFGSRLVFGPDGALFVTTGDRGDGDRAQDMQDNAGAVIRIAPDGSVPADNPKPAGWLPELWSKGHRNIQGAAWDPVTGALLTVEHGARGGDEINRPEAGRNYGWPIISYGVHYSGDRIGIGSSAEGYEQPLHYWTRRSPPPGWRSTKAKCFPNGRATCSSAR